MELYICPAIYDPESYGIITDVQISPVARHNLMQIANILQVLAMPGDDKDQKAQDLYSKFRNVTFLKLYILIYCITLFTNIYNQSSLIILKFISHY